MSSKVPLPPSSPSADPALLQVTEAIIGTPGAAVTLCDAVYGQGGSSSEDGTIVFVPAFEARCRWCPRREERLGR